MCESIDGIGIGRIKLSTGPKFIDFRDFVIFIDHEKDPQSSKLRRNSASALVNLTNTAPETMEPFFDMIHSTACKVSSTLTN